MDVLVVGAGPSGCKTAEIVAKKGYDVLILEEHPEIGKPVQCSGLVSQRIGRIPKEIIVNRIKRARFCCKNTYFEIKSNKTVYVINRNRFDKYLAKIAREAGAKFQFKKKFPNMKNKKRIYQTKLLVGADGSNSTVAKVSGIKLPDNLLFALQCRINSDFDPKSVELWFGSDVAPDNFAWIVPENENTARVGLMTNKNPNRYFEKFLKKRFGECEQKDRIGDVIRYGLIERSVSENVLLVGDAACMLKPFSAGGLVYGQVGAKYAGNACIEALETKDFSEKFLSQNYDKQWKKELSWPIIKGMLFKKLFSNISDSSILFSIIKNLKITKLSSFLDMDFLGKD